MALKSSSTGTISGASSLTIAHTVPAGTDRVMIVMASGLNSADPLSTATVTYGGVSLGSPVVLPSEALPAPSANNYVYAWTLLAPAVGTANVVITCAAGGYVDAIVCTIDGASSATPSAKAARATSFEASPATLAIAGTGRQVVDFISNRAVSKTMTPAGSQTRIGTAIAGGVSSSSGSYATNVTTMDWTHPDNGTANISRIVLAFASSGGDTTPPTMNGSLTVGTVSSTSIQTSWSAASDDVAVTSYETSTDGSTWTDRGNVLTYTFSGLSPSTSYTLRVRAKDAAGNVAATPLTATQSTTAGGGTASIDLSQASHVLKTNNGTVLANTPVKLSFQKADDDSFVVAKNLTTDASGLCGSVSDAAFAAAVVYDIKFTVVATGAKGLFPGAVAV